jgi:hypothetical protein
MKTDRKIEREFNFDKIVEAVVKKNQEEKYPLGSLMDIKKLSEDVGKKNSWWNPKEELFFSEENGHGKILDNKIVSYKNDISLIEKDFVEFYGEKYSFSYPSHLSIEEKKEYAQKIKERQELKLKKERNEISKEKSTSELVALAKTAAEIDSYFKNLDIKIKAKKEHESLVNNFNSEKSEEFDSINISIILRKKINDLKGTSRPSGWMEYIFDRKAQYTQLDLYRKEFDSWYIAYDKYKTGKASFPDITETKFPGIYKLCINEIDSYNKKRNDILEEISRLSSKKYAFYTSEEINKKRNSLRDLKTGVSISKKELLDERNAWKQTEGLRTPQQNDFKNSILNETDKRIEKTEKFIDDEAFELYSSMLDRLEKWEKEGSNLNIGMLLSKNIDEKIISGKEKNIKLPVDSLSKEDVSKWIIEATQYIENLEKKNPKRCGLLKEKCKKIKAWDKNEYGEPTFDTQQKSINPEISVALEKTKELYETFFKTPDDIRTLEPLENINKKGELNYLTPVYNDLEIAQKGLAQIKNKLNEKTNTLIALEKELIKLKKEKSGLINKALIWIGWKTDPVAQKTQELEKLKEEIDPIEKSVIQKQKEIYSIREKIILQEESAREKISKELLSLEELNPARIVSIHLFLLVQKNRHPEIKINIPDFVSAISAFPTHEKTIHNLFFKPESVLEKEIKDLGTILGKGSIEQQNLFERIYFSTLLPEWKKSLSGKDKPRSKNLRETLVKLAKIISPDGTSIPHNPELNLIRNFAGIFSKEGFSSIGDPIWMQLKHFSDHFHATGNKIDETNDEFHAFKTIYEKAKARYENFASEQNFEEIRKYSELLKPLFDLSEYSEKIEPYFDPVKNGIGIVPQISKIYENFKIGALSTDNSKKLKSYLSEMMNEINRKDTNMSEKPYEETRLENEIITTLAKKTSALLIVSFYESNDALKSLPGLLEFFYDSKTNYRTDELEAVSENDHINKQIQSELWHKLYKARDKKEFLRLWNFVPNGLKENSFSALNNVENLTLIEKLRKDKGEYFYPKFIHENGVNELSLLEQKAGTFDKDAINVLFSLDGYYSEDIKKAQDKTFSTIIEKLSDFDLETFKILSESLPNKWKEGAEYKNLAKKRDAYIHLQHENSITKTNSKDSFLAAIRNLKTANEYSIFITDLNSVKNDRFGRKISSNINDIYRSAQEYIQKGKADEVQTNNSRTFLNFLCSNISDKDILEQKNDMLDFIRRELSATKENYKISSKEEKTVLFSKILLLLDVLPNISDPTVKDLKKQLNLAIDSFSVDFLTDKEKENLKEINKIKAALLKETDIHKISNLFDEIGNLYYDMDVELPEKGKINVAEKIKQAKIHNISNEMDENLNTLMKKSTEGPRKIDQKLALQTINQLASVIHQSDKIAIQEIAANILPKLNTISREDPGFLDLIACLPSSTLHKFYDALPKDKKENTLSGSDLVYLLKNAFLKKIIAFLDGSLIKQKEIVLLKEQLSMIKDCIESEKINSKALPENDDELKINILSELQGKSATLLKENQTLKEKVIGNAQDNDLSTFAAISQALDNKEKSMKAIRDASKSMLLSQEKNISQLRQTLVQGKSSLSAINKNIKNPPELSKLNTLINDKARLNQLIEENEKKYNELIAQNKNLKEIDSLSNSNFDTFIGTIDNENNLSLLIGEKSLLSSESVKNLQTLIAQQRELNSTNNAIDQINLLESPSKKGLITVLESENQIVNLSKELQRRIEGNKMELSDFFEKGIRNLIENQPDSESKIKSLDSPLLNRIANKKPPLFGKTHSFFPPVKEKTGETEIDKKQKINIRNQALK